MDDWWKRQTYLDEIADLAFEMENTFPDRRILSLGQSPAWITRALTMVRRLKNKSANVGYMPFTENFSYRCDARDKDVMSFDLAPVGIYPAQKCIDQYFNFLALGGNHPEQIMKAAERGQKSVIVEMIRSGQGLASFLSIWAEAAGGEDRLSPDGPVSVFVFDTNPAANGRTIRVGKEGGDKMTFSLLKRELSKIEAEIMENTAPLNVAEETSSRLLPMYRLSMSAASGNKGLLLCGNEAVKKEITACIHSVVQKKFHEKRAEQKKFSPE